MIIPKWNWFSFSKLSLSEGCDMSLETLAMNLKKKTTFHIDWKKDEKKPLGQGIGFIGYSEAGLTAWTCVVIYNILYLTTFNSTMFCVFNHTSHPALIAPKCFSDKLILTSIYRNQLSSFYNNLPFTPRILISTSSKEETARNAWQKFTNQCMH